MYRSTFFPSDTIPILEFGYRPIPILIPIPNAYGCILLLLLRYSISSEGPVGDALLAPVAQFEYFPSETVRVASV